MIEINIQKTLGRFHLDTYIKSNSKRIGILGASGCGKSMTLKCIAGIETPDMGQIILEERTLYDSDQKINIKPQKRRIGYLFQNYALFPTMSVRKNIMAGLRCSREEQEMIAARMIEKFQLTGLGNRLPGELSGGQQQRVALARIMAYEPDVILLDEPFSALDEFLKDKLQQELMQMLEDYPGTVILVSHSRDEIYRFSEELVIMDKGKTICAGKTEELFAHPKWKEAARLTGCKNITKVIREDAHHLYVPAWGIRLTLQQEIPEEILYIGIRAHDFVPVWDEVREEVSDDGNQSQEKENKKLNENRLPVVVESVARLPFEHKYFLRTGGKCEEENVKAEEAKENVCWFVQRNQWKMLEERGLPAWLELPEEKILLLK